jgi:UDP-glucose 6-dehydrogenase
MNFNENQILWLIECIEYLENIHLFAKKSNSIGLLGLSYKVGTSSTLNSPSIRLAQIYSKNHFLAFDPVVKYVSNVNNIEICPSITNLFERSQTLILITPWPEILDALQSPTHSFKNQNIIDAGSWLDSEILMRFNNHRQRGRGSNA